MRKSLVGIGFAYILLDGLSVIIAFFIARWLRSSENIIPYLQLPTFQIEVSDVWRFAIAGAILYIYLGIRAKRYTFSFITQREKLTSKTIANLGEWFLIYLALVYIGHDYLYTTEIPRLIIFYSVPLIFLLHFCSEYIIHTIIHSLLRHKKIKKDRLILILGQYDQAVIDDIVSEQDIEIIGYVSQEKIQDIAFPYIGNYTKLLENIHAQTFDILLSLQPVFNSNEQANIFEYSRIYGIRYISAINAFEAAKSNTELTLIGGIECVEIRSIGLNHWGRFFKRASDIVLSGVGIILVSPIMIFLAIIIRLESKGSSLYQQKRVGKNGKIFNVYKFRSMYYDDCVGEGYGGAKAQEKYNQLIKSENTRIGAIPKIFNDPRITKVGKWIRKTSLDELPQLLNILKGDMSLIGPRPHLPSEVANYQDVQKRVLTLKPGLTGMAQVYGRHTNTFDREVQLDIWYIENWSIWLDIKIIMRTLMIFMRGA